MMAYSEDHIALAAEYALGTLDADERAQVETMMSVDKDFAAMVHAWEYRLGVLNQMVGSVEPRPEVWDRIKTAAGLSEPQAPLVLPDAPQPAPAAAAEVTEFAAVVDNSNVIRLSELSAQARRWRNVASFTDGDRGRIGRDDRGRRLSAGFASRWSSPETANAGGRGQDPANRGAAVGPICRRAAERRRVAGLHSHGRRRDQELSRFARSAPQPIPARVSNFG